MKGHPILGAISGLFLGIFGALDLLMFKVRPLDTVSVIGLPVIGLLLGLLFAAVAPFGGRRGTQGVQTPDVAAPPPPPPPPPPPE